MLDAASTVGSADVTAKHGDLWRKMRISRSLAAALRASNRSQPITVTEIRWRQTCLGARDGHWRLMTRAGEGPVRAAR